MRRKTCQVLNGFHLKLIAACTMFIDHMGHTLFPTVLWLRCIGRLSHLLLPHRRGLRLHPRSEEIRPAAAGVCPAVRSPLRPDGGRHGVVSLFPERAVDAVGRCADLLVRRLGAAKENAGGLFAHRRGRGRSACWSWPGRTIGAGVCCWWCCSTVSAACPAAPS